MDSFPYPWLFAVLGGAIILGLALAYATYQSSRASSRRKAEADKATHDLYHEDEKQN